MDNFQNTLLLENQYDGIIEIILNRPNSKNSLSKDLIKALRTKLRSLSNENNVRCIIISSKGNVFCSGHDLKELSTLNDVNKYEEIFSNCSKLMLEIQNQPQPVIAKIQGVASAAGCQLVASCDLAVADKSARFGVNGVNIGLFCSTPMVALTRAIGRKRAFEMLVTGRFIEAKEAKEIGLINKISEIDQLEKTTDELAMQITNKLGEAVKIGKEAFYKQAEMNLKDAYDYTGTVMAENMMLEQTKKGINFFLDKKTPEWDQ